MQGPPNWKLHPGIAFKFSGYVGVGRGHGSDGLLLRILEAKSCLQVPCAGFGAEGSGLGAEV